MAETIKVNYTEVRNAVSNLQSAIDKYNTLTETGFDTAITTLDGMNSDYVDKLQQVLDCLNPKLKEKVNESVSSYIEKTNYAVDTLESTEEKIADGYKGD